MLKKFQYVLVKKYAIYLKESFKKENRNAEIDGTKQETKIKDVNINKFISMITLKANDLNTLIKRHRLYEFSYIFWILVNF